MSREPRNSPDDRWVDDWWIDLIEGESTPSMREDLTLLLMNSPAGRRRLDSIKDLRALVKGSDEVPMPEDGAFYQNMHDRIMAAVDGAAAVRRAKPAAAAERKPLSAVSARQLGFPALFGTHTLMVLIASATWMTSDRSPRHAQTQSPNPPAQDAQRPKKALADAQAPADRARRPGAKADPPDSK